MNLRTPHMFRLAPTEKTMIMSAQDLTNAFCSNNASEHFIY